QELGELPPLWQLRIVRLDRDAAEIAGQSAAPLRCTAGPDHLAYMPDPAGPERREPVKMTHRDLVQRALGLRSLSGVELPAVPRTLRLPPGAALSLDEVLLALGPLRRPEADPG